MNKDLKDKVYTIPPLILSTIEVAIRRYPKNIDGTKRAKNLLTGKINYNQLKRILHDMKNYLKDNKNDMYELAGGKSFESWGWSILNSDRDVIEANKEGRKNADSMGGIQGRRNAYNKTHRKSPNFKPPSTSLKSNSETYTTLLKSGKLFEDIERIKNLMI